MWILLILFMIIYSIYLSFKLKFKNYRLNIKELIKKDKSALFLSLGTKIGVGSIIGTTSSIIIGGFSSVIWIIIFSFITTSLTYYEAYYGNKYKKDNISGPYFIIRYGLNNKYLSVISLVVIIILYSFLFQMIQVNTISNVLKNIHNINNIYIIILVFVILLATINLSVDEVKRIMNILVPFKIVLFIFVCLFGIINHFNDLISSFKIEFNNLLTFKSIMSGFVIGTLRSIFMNEILIGTTSIASGSDKNNIDVSIRYQLFSIYFITLMNTLLITSIILIYKYNNNIVNDYNLLITRMFYYIGGSTSVYILFIILVLFALTTILSGYYILKSNINYIFNNKQITNICSVIFLIVVVSSIFINNSYLWEYTDYLIFIMIIINSYCIIKLMRK